MSLPLVERHLRGILRLDVCPSARGHSIGVALGSCANIDCVSVVLLCVCVSVCVCLCVCVCVYVYACGSDCVCV